MYTRMISAHRNLFAVCTVAVFCLASVSLSAPLACEDLTRPLDRLVPRHLEGRWALVAGSLSDPTQLEFFKRRDSSSVNFSNTSAASNILYTPSVHFGGKCHLQSFNVSLEGSILTFDVRDRVNLTVTFLNRSCKDCVLMRFDNESKELKRLFLFSRRREVEQREMEEFTAQAECLNMPPPVVMDPNKELCFEQSTSQSAPAPPETEQR
ncbi:uncharacterized protein [Pagrus major]|uniref:uncharacterized protein n=1 Tax=Pagrus major TaxID=143350 RepID=UPI003CC86AD5